VYLLKFNTLQLLAVRKSFWSTKLCLSVSKGFWWLLHGRHHGLWGPCPWNDRCLQFSSCQSL